MKLEELEKQYKKLGEEIERLKNGKKEWKPEYNQLCWFYDKDTEEVRSNCWTEDDIDYTRLKNKVIFETKAEAQRYADYQKAKKEYSYEFSREEWESTLVNKYYIEYDYKENELMINANNFLRPLGKTYFKTEKQAQKFIDKYKAEMLEFE